MNKETIEKRFLKIAYEIIIEKADEFLNGGKFTFGSVDSCPLCLLFKSGWCCGNCPLTNNNKMLYPCLHYAPPKYRGTIKNLDEAIDTTFRRLLTVNRKKRLKSFVKAIKRDFEQRIKDLNL